MNEIYKKELILQALNILYLLYIPSLQIEKFLIPF